LLPDLKWLEIVLMKQNNFLRSVAVIMIFCCLDFFDPPGVVRKPSSKSTDRFLRNIQTSDRLQIWGYRAGLGYKIVILTLHIVSFQESAMQPLCEAVRDILFDAIMDPFPSPGCHRVRLTLRLQEGLGRSDRPLPKVESPVMGHPESPNRPVLTHPSQWARINQSGSTDRSESTCSHRPVSAIYVHIKETI
jgi:hypothetical protein